MVDQGRLVKDGWSRGRLVNGHFVNREGITEHYPKLKSILQFCDIFLDLPAVSVHLFIVWSKDGWSMDGY